MVRRRRFPFQGVANNDYVVGNKFFHPIAGHGTVLVNALSGHDGGHPHLLEASHQAKNFSPHDGSGIVLLKHRRHRVDGDPPGLVFANGVLNALNQSRQVKITYHILAFGVGGGIEDEQLAFFNSAFAGPSQS